MLGVHQQMFWKRLQITLLLITLSTSIVWLSLFWHCVQTRPRTPQPLSGNVIPLHSHGVTVYVTTGDRFKLRLSFYSAATLGLTMVLIHLWKEPFKADNIDT
jgi:hypothetical protein